MNTGKKNNSEESEETKKVKAEEVVVALLKEKNLTLSLAESCTGGAVAAKIVNVPGASDIFPLGFVTYSNEAKHQCLGVKNSTLEKHGAVSEKCAREMAAGAAEAAGTTASLSVTGIAGPGGGTPETPVGTVFMGCCVNGKIKVKEYHFEGSRAEIRKQSVKQGLKLLKKCILKWG